MWDGRSKALAACARRSWMVVDLDVRGDAFAAGSERARSCGGGRGPDAPDGGL